MESDVPPNSSFFMQWRVRRRKEGLETEGATGLFVLLLFILVGCLQSWTRSVVLYGSSIKTLCFSYLNKVVVGRDVSTWLFSLEQIVDSLIFFSLCLILCVYARDVWELVSDQPLVSDSVSLNWSSRFRWSSLNTASSRSQSEDAVLGSVHHTTACYVSHV